LSRKWGWGVGLAFGLCLLLLGLWGGRYPDQPGPSRDVAVTVEIPAGSGLVTIRDLLAQAGVIPNDFRFLLLVKWLGAARRLQAGEYAFPPGLSPRAVILELVAGKTVPHAITLPEGYTLYQAAETVESGGWGRQADFLGLAADPAFIASLGLQVPLLEGYLFPDTYFFAKGTELRLIIRTMVKRMGQVLTEERAETSSFSRHELLTLASIVEKETALMAERPLVAKVFVRRLQQGMKLQADPTVIYGLAKFDAPLSKGDLDRRTPYNTYVNRGLPVGPICNPGRTAIAAVLHPAEQEYLYFVSQNDGTHYFSQTLTEHNQAVARYRARKEAAQGQE